MTFSYDGYTFNVDDNYVVLQWYTQDGGDAPAREGDLFFYIGTDTIKRDDFQRFQSIYKAALAALQVPGQPGNYYRYPPQPQYKIASDFSRDQAEQLSLGMAAMDLKEDQLDMYWADIKRFSRTPNGDIIGLGTWAMRLRKLWHVGCWWVVPLYPLIFLGDFSQVVNALLLSFLIGRPPGKIRNYLASKLNMWWLIQGVNSPNPVSADQYGVRNVGDDVLFVLNVLVSKRWLATPFSWLARKLYAWFRPTFDVPYSMVDPASNSSYNDGLCDRTNGATYSWDVYFMNSSYANPFNGLYRARLREEIK